LVAALLVGFAFIPLFLLRNESGVDQNNFVDFGTTLIEMVKFLDNNSDSLKSWEYLSSIKIAILLFILFVVLLFNNALISLLSINIEATFEKGEIKLYKKILDLNIDVEKCLLTSGERRRLDWFPTWLTYIVNEDERTEWEKWMKKNEKEWKHVLADKSKSNNNESNNDI
ncbi:15908_t:CDS:2, partial [Racocetra persica]